MKILLLITMLLSGCVRTQNDLARYVDTTLLVTSTTTIACDWGYTHKMADAGWGRYAEANPLLGPRPSTGEVNAYFVSMIALNAIAWVLTPPKYRAIVPLVVTVRQSYAISNNTETVGGFCGY